ncbi:MAG: metallophosphoesterase, partial [Candidatus Diapherotrites archaeon]|nr:metallophosphoesterase [Candidatus Diapherotrites archaeon]
MEEKTQTVSDDKAKQVVALANDRNVALSAAALELLSSVSLTDAGRVLDELSEKGLFIIGAPDVEARLMRTKLSASAPDVTVLKTGFRPAAKEYSANCRELKQLNFSTDMACEGTVQDFARMFGDQFETLSGVLRSRQGFSPRPISQVKTSSSRDVEFIAMVTEKWVTKNGNLAFRLEDLEDECIALVLKSDDVMLQAARPIMADEVIGVKGKKGKGDLIILAEIMQPDLPLKSPQRITEPLSIAVISDLHVGSKLFLEKELDRFLSFLNGRSDSEKERELAGRIKYLVVAGDTVDGIGVYPGQISKLLIKDLHAQYAALEDILLQVPDYIEVFIIPGQHDAVRWADPQPPIGKAYLPRLHELKNYHMLPSPGWVEIEGLKTVLYHGAALHELYNFNSRLSMTKPELAMIEILKRRSFMLNFGNKQPYAPEKKDYLLIREEPDLYFGGDMHHIGFDTYRGCT